MAQPATIAFDLRERTKALLTGATRFLDRDFVWRRLFTDAEKLYKADAVNGSLEKAFLYHIVGDVKETRYWVDNARRLSRTKHEVLVSEMAMLGNLGFFSESALLYSQSVKLESNRLTEWYCFGCLTANFSDMIANKLAAEKANLDLGAEKETAMASQCDAVLKRLQITEQQVQAMLDVAGEVLRERKLFWLEQLPVIHTWNNADGAGLLYELKVGLSPDEAFALTEAVVDRLIERELDAPGLSFSFIGINHEAMQ